MAGRHRSWFVASAITSVAAAVVIAGAIPAGACAGLVTPSGNVRVDTTTTLAAHHDGVEHYVTSFAFSGGGAEFGSLVPLPGNPSKIERGGDWTLQRLIRERDSRRTRATPAAAGGSAAFGDSAEVVQTARIDALDVTILKGGAASVGEWARKQGFKLSPDAPAVLDFYAARSPYFMATVFDGKAAQDRGQQVGEGTPVHLTIPLENPWVPLRILGLGQQGGASINATVFLLTDRRPALLHGNTPGVRVDLDEPASSSLLADLRSDKGMEWVPERMHLMSLDINEQQGRLSYDLATDVTDRQAPSAVAAGLVPPPKPTPKATTTAPAPPATEPTTTTAADVPVTTTTVTEDVEEAAPVPLATEPASSTRPLAAAGIAALLVVVAALGAMVVRRRASS